MNPADTNGWSVRNPFLFELLEYTFHRLSVGNDTVFLCRDELAAVFFLQLKIGHLQHHPRRNFNQRSERWQVKRLERWSAIRGALKRRL